MRKIDLDQKEHVFMLGEYKCVYTENELDKKKYIEYIQSIDQNEDLSKSLISIFSIFLKRENPLVEVIDNDLVGLFNFFNFIFLRK